MSRELNIPMLRKVVEWVEEQEALPWWRSQWNQEDWIQPRSWFFTSVQGLISQGVLNTLGITEREALDELNSCGTAYCVAGWVGATFGPEDYKYTAIVYDEAYGAPLHVSDWAARELGLNEYQQRKLFHGANSAGDIRYYAERFAGEKL